jgi:hypothetical protein
MTHLNFTFDICVPSTNNLGGPKKKDKDPFKILLLLALATELIHLSSNIFYFLGGPPKKEQTLN